MGKGSPESQAEKGSAHTDGQTAQQIRRSISRAAFGPDHRLGHPQEFTRVRCSGHRFQDPILTVWRARGTTLRARVAVVVALHGNSAVARNRLKRRLRYIVRSEILPEASEPWDIILSARPHAYGATFKALRTSVLKAFLA